MAKYPARIYRPAHQQQKRTFNGKLIGCTETSFAMFVDAVTFGGCIVSESHVRSLSNEPVPNPASPGLNIDQIDDVAKKLRVEYNDATGTAWTTLVKWLDQNRRIHAQLWYADIGGTNIGHAILIQARRTRSGKREMLINDPMKKAEQWIAESKVKTAMDRFGTMTGVPGLGLRFAYSKRLPYVAAGAV
jgi:hypothetical protein